MCMSLWNAKFFYTIYFQLINESSPSAETAFWDFQILAPLLCRRMAVEGQLPTPFLDVFGMPRLERHSGFKFSLPGLAVSAFTNWPTNRGYWMQRLCLILIVSLILVLTALVTVRHVFLFSAAPECFLRQDWARKIKTHKPLVCFILEERRWLKIRMRSQIFGLSSSEWETKTHHWRLSVQAKVSSF